MKEFGTSYPIWRDPDESTLAQFRINGVRETFLVEREGVPKLRRTDQFSRVVPR